MQPCNPPSHMACAIAGGEKRIRDHDTKNTGRVLTARHLSVEQALMDDLSSGRIVIGKAESRRRQPDVVTSMVSPPKTNPFQP